MKCYFDDGKPGTGCHKTSPIYAVSTRQDRSPNIGGETMYACQTHVGPCAAIQLSGFDDRQVTVYKVTNSRISSMVANT